LRPARLGPSCLLTATNGALQRQVNMSDGTTKREHGQADVVYLADEDAVRTLVTGAIQGLWEVVNQLTRLRRT